MDNELWRDRERVDAEVPSLPSARLRFDGDLYLYVHRGKPFTGFCAYRYLDGTLESLSQFAGGVAHGVSVGWYPGGQIKFYTETAHDVRHGLHVEWAEGGSESVREQYREGRRIRPARGTRAVVRGGQPRPRGRRP